MNIGISGAAKALTALLLALSLGLCGCSQNDSGKNDSDNNDLSSASEDVSKVFIERKDAGEPSAPEGSISFEKACELLDDCSLKETYLPQSMKDYKKMYFGTIDYMSEKFYSVYPYIEAANKKIFVGTNCLVACDGSFSLKKTWIGEYSELTESADSDKSFEELYPGAKVTPNEILTVLAENEKSLSLEYDITKYIFEVGGKIFEIDGKKCYKIIPKLEYMDSVTILQSFYGTIDGSNEIWKADLDNDGKYKKIV